MWVVDADTLAYLMVNDAAVAPTISVAQQGTALQITYTGILQATTTIGGQWTNVLAAPNPYIVTPAAGPGASFYRAKQ